MNLPHWHVRVLILIFLVIGAVACSSTYFFAQHKAPIETLVTLLGPKYRGFKEYIPSTTDHKQRAIIDAANKRLIDEKWLTEQQVQMYKKLLRYDQARRLWQVAYLDAMDFMGDSHTTLFFVEVDKDLGSRFLRLLAL